MNKTHAQPRQNYKEPPIGSYFLTITLKPMYYGLQVSKQFEMTKNLIKQICMQYVDELHLIPELTNKKVNIHYHGWYLPRCENHIDYLTDNLKQVGLIDIRPVKNSELDRQRTFSYMLKDLERTQRMTKVVCPRIYYKRKIQTRYTDTEPNIPIGTIDLCDDNIIFHINVNINK